MIQFCHLCVSALFIIFKTIVFACSDLSNRHKGYTGSIAVLYTVANTVTINKRFWFCMLVLGNFALYLSKNFILMFCELPFTYKKTFLFLYNLFMATAVSSVIYCFA